MFGSDILEIAMGLVLVYLLMSLVMTAVQEAIQQFLKTRAVVLDRAVRELLQRDEALIKRFYEHPLVYALHRGPRLAGQSAASGKPTRSELPSYIPREIFSAAIVDLMARGEAATNAELRQAIEGLNRFVGDDVKQLRKEVERWYDGAMDRASGVYKRHAQLSLFLLGLGVSLAMNVNTVTIARHLAVDPQARQLADQMAVRLAQSGLPRPAKPADGSGQADALASVPPESNASGAAPSMPAPARADLAALQEKSAAAGKAWHDFERQMEEIGLPIGWDQASMDKIREGFPEGGLQWAMALLTWLLGYFLTAIAVMLGAPFWFDVLNRIMVIRSTVKPKEKSPDEPPVDGKKADKDGRGAAADTATA